MEERIEEQQDGFLLAGVVMILAGFVTGLAIGSLPTVKSIAAPGALFLF